MSVLRPNRRKDRNSDAEGLRFMAWIRETQECLICKLLGLKQRTVTEAAHVGGNLAAKVSNWRTIPLCYAHHRDGSATCEEILKRSFWRFYGLDRETTLQDLRERFEREKE